MNLLKYLKKYWKSLNKKQPNLAKLISTFIILILFLAILWVIQIVIIIFGLIQRNYQNIIAIVVVFTILILFLKFTSAKKRTDDQIKLEMREEITNEKLKEIVELIEHFKPAKKFENEYLYQITLYTYLKQSFPKAKLEEQRGSSRPDIVIDDIAIEIKGPTTTEDLVTIADKLLRYSQNFREIIVVLFDVKVSRSRFFEWLEGIKSKFPEVIVIEK